jgi:inositol 1,4,5-triphosphate receptor type 1
VNTAISLLLSEYTELGGDEELPLGEEFQEHVACFINPNAPKSEGKYAMATKLVEQLHISAGNAQINEKDRLNQEELDIKCLQLLRAIIHNEIVKLPDDWESDLKGNRKWVCWFVCAGNFVIDVCISQGL